MRKLLITGAVFACLIMAPQFAQATLIPFSGSGASGTLSPGTEPFQYGACSPPSSCDNDVIWSSPSISGGFATYNENRGASSFEVTFTSVNATLDAGEITNGNGAACAGGTGGGTTFCSGIINPVQWAAMQIGSNSIEFIAPPGTTLVHGGTYFVNIFLDAGTGVSGGAFNGNWAAAPEPASAGLLAAGLLALGWIRRRRG